MGFWSGLGKVLGVAGAGIAAPFTGGTSLSALPAILGAGGAALGALGQSAATNRGAAAAWGANWKAWGIAGFLFVALLGALSWTAGQLYALEPGRIAAENAKK